MSDLVWEDPPQEERTKWEDYAKQLRAQPGKSARLKTSHDYNKMSATKSHIKRGRYKGFDEGQFDAQVSKIDPKNPQSDWGVYAWYIG